MEISIQNIFLQRLLLKCRAQLSNFLEYHLLTLPLRTSQQVYKFKLQSSFQLIFLSFLRRHFLVAISNSNKTEPKPGSQNWHVTARSLNSPALRKLKKIQNIYSCSDRPSNFVYVCLLIIKPSLRKYKIQSQSSIFCGVKTEFDLSQL